MINKAYPRASGSGLPTNHQRYAKTGEFRNPKMGEYYLSGAIPEAYRASHNMSVAYNILREVEEIPQPPKQYKWKE
jgi:hypothetical protein